MENQDLEILRKNLESLEKSLFRLKYSYSQSKNINLQKELTDPEFDVLENLSSRFARTLDLVVSKVFRSIDAVELEDAGTLIDVINRAEKRELIESSTRIRELKDLRNQIVHEYETEDLEALFEQIVTFVPEILGIAENVKSYCISKKYLQNYSK